MPEAPPLSSTTLFSRRGKGWPLHNTRGDAAVGRNLRAGHVARAVGGEPQHDLADLLGLGHAVNGMAPPEKGLALLVTDGLPQGIEDRCVDRARMHRIAADVVFLLGAI